jgi:hypothetical protein
MGPELAGHPGRGGDVEAPARAHGNPAYVSPGLLAGRYYGTYQIASDEAMVALGPREDQSREPVSQLAPWRSMTKQTLA